MWFKQIQVFQLSNPLPSPDKIIEKLEQLAFTSCLPSLPQSAGWVSPLEEDNAPLVRIMNGYMMICLQIEEKILPNTVIQQELAEVIKQTETSQNRKLRQKEKFSLKDEVIMALLPRAFSKFTKIYAYIDAKNRWLVLGTANLKKTEQFIATYKKTISEEIQAIDVNNVSYTMTSWLKQKNYPSSFTIEKACVLQDPQQENRIVRCRQQDLFAQGIQSLIKDGCDVVQLALSWQERVNFVLSKDFSLSSLQFQDEIMAQAKEMEPETKQQQFDADFLIMIETLSALLKELLHLFTKSSKSEDIKMDVAKIIPMVKQA